MKPPLRERLLTAGMYWAEYRRRYAMAMARLEKLEARRPLDVREQAFKAYLLLRTMQPDEAHILFARVHDQVRGRTDAEGRYLAHYALYWLGLIREDPFKAREQSREARKVECEPRLKRQLWVGNWDAQDPLDAEFDAWIGANPPPEEGLRKRPPGAPRT